MFEVQVFFSILILFDSLIEKPRMLFELHLLFVKVLNLEEECEIPLSLFKQILLLIIIKEELYEWIPLQLFELQVLSVIEMLFESPIKIPRRVFKLHLLFTKELWLEDMSTIP